MSLKARLHGFRLSSGRNEDETSDCDSDERQRQPSTVSRPSFSIEKVVSQTGPLTILADGDARH